MQETPGNIKHISKSRPLYIVCLLIVGYIFLYEWGIFEAELLRTWVTAAKLLVPGLLLLLVPIKKVPSRAFRRFILFYLIFMIWGLAPGIVNGEFQISALTWFKYLPRFFFAVLAGIYFLRTPIAATAVMKLLVLIGVLSVIQFCILVPLIIFDYVEGFTIAGARGLFFGPYGVLGNQVALMTFPGLSFPVLRLTGFWLEPSNASGFLFAAFFLGQVVYHSGQKLFWRIMSYICLAGGFLCLSNAGYLAFAAPILFACLFMKKSGTKFAYVMALSVLALGLGYFAVRGRSLANDDYTESSALKALSGARVGGADDPYGGRVELLQKNLSGAITNPFGIGMKVSGEGAEGSYREASASAPVLWLAYTGFVGLILLLLREYQIMIVALKYARESPLVMGASQAWLAMFVQHLAYGTWMTPAYLVMCALVVSTVLHHRVTVRANEAPRLDSTALRLRQIMGPRFKSPVLITPSFPNLPEKPV